MATPAFAAVQNVKVSGNILSSYVNRQDFDLGSVGGSSYNQSFFLTQTRLRVDADLSDNVSTTVGLINERDWSSEGTTVTGTNASNQNTEIDLNLAYVTLREMLYSPLTVVVGRQTFAYGNSLVFDATGTNNSSNGRLNGVAQDFTLRSALDGVRAILDYKPLTIETFYAKGADNNVKGAGNQKDDLDYYGVNANYQLGDAMNTVVEGYFFAKADQTSNGFNPNAIPGSKQDNVFAPGLRASTNPIKGLNVQGEIAWQRGTKVIAGGDNLQRDAMAIQGMASYTLPVAEKYKPMVSGSYTYVSGDSNPTNTTTPTQRSSNKWTGWDPFLENQGSGTIYNTIFNLTNMHIVSAAVSANPLEDVNAKLSWTGLWADKSLDRQNGGATPGNGTLAATYFTEPDGSTITPRVTSNKDLGQEFDANITYNYTEDVQFGLTAGYFFPGGAFDSANNQTAKQVIGSVGVNF